MEEYFVTKNNKENDDCEVHKNNCFYLPTEENRISLGFFYNYFDAIKKAKKYYALVRVCSHCSCESNKSQ